MGFLIPIFPVIFRAGLKPPIIFFFSQLFSYLCHTPIRNGIFQAFRYGFFLPVCRNIISLFQILQSLVVTQHRAFHSFERLFIIESRYSLQYSICDNRNRLYADHLFCVGTIQMPYRKQSLLLIDCQHRANKIRDSFRL